jgi:hypothetical protein
LHAALQEASAGDELTIEFGGIRDGRAVMALRCSPARQPVSAPEMLQHLTTLAARMQADLRVHDQGLTLAMPVGLVAPASDVDLPAAVTAADTRPPSGEREPGHDVRGAREREHRESRAL